MFVYDTDPTSLSSTFTDHCFLNDVPQNTNRVCKKWRKTLNLQQERTAGKMAQKYKNRCKKCTENTVSGGITKKRRQPYIHTYWHKIYQYFLWAITNTAGSKTIKELARTVKFYRWNFMFFLRTSSKISQHSLFPILCFHLHWKTSSMILPVCLFHFTVQASPDWTKHNVMPEIRSAMVIWGNTFVSRTLAATSWTIIAGTFKLAIVQTSVGQSNEK